MIDRKIKKTALLLCIFFGWFGAHRYYTEKWLTAILYTATLGLFGFGWLIDIALIAADQFLDASGQPLLKAGDLTGGTYGVYAVPPQKVPPAPAGTYRAADTGQYTARTDITCPENGDPVLHLSAVRKRAGTVYRGKQDVRILHLMRSEDRPDAESRVGRTQSPTDLLYGHGL